MVLYIIRSSLKDEESRKQEEKVMLAKIWKRRISRRTALKWPPLRWLNGHPFNIPEMVSSALSTNTRTFYKIAQIYFYQVTGTRREKKSHCAGYKTAYRLPRESLPLHGLKCSVFASSRKLLPAKIRDPRAFIGRSHGRAFRNGDATVESTAKADGI